MSMPSNRYNELYEMWRHARQIALESIGQPDRAANRAYRDELWRQLQELISAESND
ncbi:hypothetical protein PBI_TURJ99_73 [Mycobacterium phage Turj99]|uniref:Uncharacterized protein n=1 Tax=Mycobacterium phage Bxb1 TaxID=2902907 RepID=Q9B050_BPMB1|nr:gp71 [Mycobacterium phage Bxb1]YP_009211785.1 hypothetical protein PBI_TURJ99_73 [Mycobacterium phage Turj99]AAG59776.1 hypothetical protein PBI_BXB1_71 [Mycobacterium phage Bxb1]ALF02667.1 hypothetical protein PBI_TURJ99_73 [Mycobacterium phage Turj99]